MLSKKLRRIVRGLGHPLRRFQAASDELYRLSAQGRREPWVAQVLDAGKPDWLVAHQRARREERPRVIRPDLLVMEDGVKISELDSVPGGIGVLAWLSEAYTKAGFELLGGEKGMLEGFASIMPNGGEILVSDEAADYRPEMEWLADQLGRDRFSVSRAEEFSGEKKGDVYRFFECFDWENIPAVRDLAARGQMTPPLKPHLEEKSWLALFWAPALQPVWEQLLRGSHLRRLRASIPYGWVVDPMPLPPHAALPRLEVGSWSEVVDFSQKKRQLALKVSGFNENAWGSRGVVIGHDVSGEEWKAAIQNAQDQFPTQPWMMQEFANAAVVEHPYFDPQTGERKVMEGRVRLCPYYFEDQVGVVSLGGCLATIVPADKKKIHGMRDGILVPCV